MNQTTRIILCASMGIAIGCAGSAFDAASIASGGTSGRIGAGGATGGIGAGGDSGTGGAQDGGSGTGGLPATGGSTGVDYSGMTCDQLSTAYESELVKAKSCTPNTPTVQCDKTVPNKPICGCDTFVASEHVEAIKNLSSIADAYTNKNCVATCPLIACVAPQSATCQGTTGGGALAGQCVDGP